MKSIQRLPRESGFAAVEMVITGVIVVSVAAGLGYVAYQGFAPAPSQANVSSQAAVSSATSPAPAGTTAHIDQLIQQDVQTEASFNESSDSQAAQDSTSSASDVSGVGGAYDETNL